MMMPIGNLRHVNEEDLELIRSWRNHPDIASKMYTRHKISSDEHKAWWNRTRARDDQAYFMYETAKEPMGVVGFTQIDLANDNCVWAFYANPAAPKGTGSRMEFLALEHVFQTLELHKLSCEVLAFNQPVIKLHKKFGFRQEGVFRDHHKMDGRFIDIVRFGMLAEEWAGVRDKFAEILNNSSEVAP
nr:UDP-4-amino-4,6-dideoxy-N-acetyl-beta-L-altrosamine N-acetyltransferase [uncultured Roseovarius sp.]